MTKTLLPYSIKNFQSLFQKMITLNNKHKFIKTFHFRYEIIKFLFNHKSIETFNSTNIVYRPDRL